MHPGAQPEPLGGSPQPQEARLGPPQSRGFSAFHAQAHAQIGSLSRTNEQQLTLLRERLVGHSPPPTPPLPDWDEVFAAARGGEGGGGGGGEGGGGGGSGSSRPPEFDAHRCARGMRRGCIALAHASRSASALARSMLRL